MGIHRGELPRDSANSGPELEEYTISYNCTQSETQIISFANNIGALLVSNPTQFCPYGRYQLLLKKKEMK